MEEQEYIKTLRTYGKEKEYRRHSAVNGIFFFLEIIAVIIILFLLCFRTVSMTDASMSPTLLSGDVLLSGQISLFVRTPIRGDLVTFLHPRERTQMIRRVIGLPGETIRIFEGRVYVDDHALDESSYIPSDAASAKFIPDMEAVTVPDGSVFLLADNRADTEDSRNADIGVIPFSDLTGTIRVRVSPIDNAAIFT